MMVNSFYVSTAGIGIVIKGESRIIDEIKQDPFLDEYIPNLQKDHKLGGAKKVLLVQGNINGVFEIHGDQAIIDIRTVKTAKDTISLIEHAAEHWRQESFIYTIHGAACSFNGYGILILGGASGIGKSSLVNYLCNNFAATFITDEKVLVNSQNKIVGGIGTPNDKKFNPLEINMIIQPVIARGAKLSVVQWDKSKISWHLYEELSRKIRGTSRRINNSIPIQSVDSEQFAKMRSDLANQLAAKLDKKATTVYGDIKPVSIYIKELLSS